MPAAPPPSGQPAPPSADESYAAAEQQRSEQIAAEVPQASEPIKATSLAALHTGIVAVIDSLTDGQMRPPPSPEPGNYDAVPPELFAHMSAIGAGFQELAAQVPEAEPYAFDPAQAATTNKGVIEAGQAMKKAAGDKALKRAIMSGPAPKKAEPKDEATGEPPGLSDEDMEAMT